MSEASTPITFDRVARIAFSCFVLWALVNMSQYLSDVLIPFGVAVLIAYLTNPLVELIQRKVPNRVAAVFLALSAVSVTVIGLSYFCVSMIVSETLHFADLVQQLAQDREWKDKLMALVPEQFVAEIEQTLSQDGIVSLLSTEGAWAYASEYAASIAPWLKDFGLGVMGLLGLSVVVLYVVFLLIDYDWFQKNWNKVVPPQHRGGVDGFMGEFNSAMNRHFRAQAVVALCCAVLFAIGFSIIGLPMAILFGLFVGFLNMIPYVQILAIIPASLLATMHSLETGSSLGMGMVWVLLIFVIVQLVQDAILVPRIMGEAFGLRPVVILLSTMIWGKILGLLGLIIALPLTCLAWAWYRRLVIIPQEEELTQQEQTPEQA